MLNEQVTEKACSKCGEVKPLDAFYRDRQRANGRGSYCKGCQSVRSSDWAKRNPDKYRTSQLRIKYGITLEEYDELARNGCHICGSECQSGNRLAVDHDHETGAVRGALCRGCNLALGHMGDDPDRLRLAAAYLERTSG